MTSAKPPIFGLMMNLVCIALLAVGIFTPEWISGAYGTIGLWSQCLYTYPCTEPHDLPVFLARYLLLLSFSLMILAFFTGAINGVWSSAPFYILSAFLLFVAGLIGLVGCLVFVCGYYIRMDLSYSWLVSLCGSILAVTGGPLAYVRSFHVMQKFCGRNPRFQEAAHLDAYLYQF